MEKTDEELVLACRRGDEAAWEVLVRRYQRLIYAIPRRAGLDDEAAADVFQRTFAQLLNKLDALEQPSRIGAWLTTTAKRESWRMAQRDRLTVPLPTASSDEGDDEPADLRDDAPLPEEAVEQLEQQHAIRLALQAIDETCRKLLTLLFFRPEPPPYSEIAQTLGMSEGSIGPIRARCLQKLRKQLDRMQFDI